jgi:hypothetical protein
MARRGRAALTVCSTAFLTLGRMQAAALGIGELPIVAIPHPFGIRSRSEVGEIAKQYVDEIAKMATEGIAR